MVVVVVCFYLYVSTDKKKAEKEGIDRCTLAVDESEVW